jgi:hypothetical protein
MARRFGWRSGNLNAYNITASNNISANNLTIAGGTVAPAARYTYYVDPTSGSDANAGTSWSAAFKTVQKAVDATTDRGGSLILVGPGKIQENVLLEKDHDAVYLKAVFGPWETQWRASDGSTKHAFTDTNAEAGSATGIGLFVGARGCVVDGFCFDGGGGYVGVVVGDGYGVGDVTEGTSQNPASCKIINCLFRAGNEGTAIPALVLKGCSDNVVVENNFFRECDYGVYIASGSGRTNQTPIIRNNHFIQCSTYGVYHVNESTDTGIQVVDNVFLDGNGNTMTYAVKMQGTGVHLIANNKFGCTNTFSASATDFQSGNSKPVAGNSVTYIEMEA